MNTSVLVNGRWTEDSQAIYNAIQAELPSLTGSARQRLLAEAAMHGVTAEVNAILAAADKVGSGYLEALGEYLNGPGDENDMEAGGPCGESAEVIYSAAKPLRNRNGIVVAFGGTGTGYNGPGNVVHNWVTITFNAGTNAQVTYVIDNGAIGGADHVGAYSELKNFLGQY